MFDLFITYLKESNGLLLILLGGVFRIWQQQIKMKSDVKRDKLRAEEVAAEHKVREAQALVRAKELATDAKEKADRLAREVKREAELSARQERDKLEMALERERGERHKEMAEGIHHLRNKMQVYENELALHAKQNELEKKEMESLQRSLFQMEGAQQDMRERVRAKDEDLKELQERVALRDAENDLLRQESNRLRVELDETRKQAAHLSVQVQALEAEVVIFRQRKAREDELESLLEAANLRLAKYDDTHS